MEKQIDRILIIPGVRSGKPIIKGTRITVGDVLELLAAGQSHDEIVEDYPKLTGEDVRAVLRFAGDRDSISINVFSASNGGYSDARAAG